MGLQNEQNGSAQVNGPMLNSQQPGDGMNAGRLPGGDVDSFGINGVGRGVVFNPNGQQSTDVANAISPFQIRPTAMRPT